MARPNGGCYPCFPVNSPGVKVYPDGVPPPPQTHLNFTVPKCCESWNKFLVLFIIIILFIAFVSLSGYGIYTCITSPEAPKFQFDSAIFTSLDNVTGPNPTAKLNITFIVTNPNKNYNIFYDTIIAILDYGGGCELKLDKFSPLNFCNVLASAHFPTFLQLNNTNNTLPFQLNVVDQIVGDTIFADRARGSVEFGLKLIARFSLKDYDSNTAEFYCKRLSFVFNSNNTTFVSGRCLSDPSDLVYLTQ